MPRLPDDYDPDSPADDIAAEEALRVTGLDMDAGLDDYAPDHYRKLGFAFDESGELQELDFDAVEEYDRWGTPTTEDDYG